MMINSVCTEKEVRKKRTSFHLLAKPTGAKCNLNCEYCFYLEKEKNYPMGDFCMSEATLERYIAQLFVASAGLEVVIAWQGGEPMLMGLPFFEKAVELTEKYRPRGSHAVHTIQTNATLITEDWAKFFKKHRFLVGVSIDGPQEFHDENRKDRNGKPTYDTVMRSIEMLHRYRVPMNALCTVNATNQDHPESVYSFLRDTAGMNYMQFIPIVNATSDGQVDCVSVDEQKYGQFLNTVYDIWLTRDVGKVYVQLFDVTLAKTLCEPSGYCVHEKTCGRSLVLEHNGDVFACDHFCDTDHFRGNIFSQDLLDMVLSADQTAFGCQKSAHLCADCHKCEWLPLCGGGCLKDRILPSEPDSKGLNYLCRSYKDFFEHSAVGMRAMADLLRAGRSPAQVMGSDPSKIIF